jgi:putative hemolysin
MSATIVEVIIILLLIMANGIFSMSEIAVISARKMRLQQRAEDGVKGAQTALELAESPNRFLSTVQIGITLIGILSGALGATLSKPLAMDWPGTRA